MTPVFAVELFDQEFNPLFLVGIVALIFLYLLFNRGGGMNSSRAGGRGMSYRCQRCGVQFQPERVETLGGGNTRSYYDERCPNCGWELDWGRPEDRPGGASGGW